ncbi:hypothetical protein Acr_00g0081880 [Actinidia rufa]|uniref:Uncharacterized protein n=1 Tax=Actinidia rufa TaxID=165716 RepID=A0A7J0DUF7_9ERIC|nr:hypothetical protein Acr_00g0081880 [Actinidia rufa]
MQHDTLQPLQGEQGEVEDITNIDPISYWLSKENTVSAMTDDQKPIMQHDTIQPLEREQCEVEDITNINPISYWLPEENTEPIMQHDTLQPLQGKGEQGEVEDITNIEPISYRLPEETTVSPMRDDQDLIMQHEALKPLQGEQSEMAYITNIEPISYELPEENTVTAMTDDQVDTSKPLHKYKGNAEDIIEAYPISYKLPESNTIYEVKNDKSLKMQLRAMKSSEEEQDKITNAKDAEKLQLTIEDRKEGWIEQPRKRDNGRQDKTTKTRGASLLRKIEVGTYNLQTKTVSLRATTQVVGEHPPNVNIDKEAEASGGNKERVRGENPMKEGEYTFGQAIKSTDTTSALDNDAVPYINFEFR